LINTQSDQKHEKACKEDRVNNLHVSKARKQAKVAEKERRNIWLLCLF